MYRVIISDAPGVQYIHRVMRSDAVSQKATARSIDESVEAKFGARMTCKSTYDCFVYWLTPMVAELRGTFLKLLQ
jgi:glucokinase